MKKSSNKLINDFALGLYLSQYPTDQSFKKILERLSEDDLEGEYEEELIVIYEPFEGTDPSNIAERIQTSRDNLITLIQEVITEEATK